MANDQTTTRTPAAWPPDEKAGAIAPCGHPTCYPARCGKAEQAFAERQADKGGAVPGAVPTTPPRYENPNEDECLACGRPYDDHTAAEEEACTA